MHLYEIIRNRRFCPMMIVLLSKQNVIDKSNESNMTRKIIKQVYNLLK